MESRDSEDVRQPCCRGCIAGTSTWRQAAHTMAVNTEPVLSLGKPLGWAVAHE